MRPVDEHPQVVAALLRCGQEVHLSRPRSLNVETFVDSDLPNLDHLHPRVCGRLNLRPDPHLLRLRERVPQDERGDQDQDYHQPSVAAAFLPGRRKKVYGTLFLPRSHTGES